MRFESAERCNVRTFVRVGGSVGKENRQGMWVGVGVYDVCYESGLIECGVRWEGREALCARMGSE